MNQFSTRPYVLAILKNQLMSINAAVSAKFLDANLEALGVDPESLEKWQRAAIFNCLQWELIKQIDDCVQGMQSFDATIVDGKLSLQSRHRQRFFWHQRYLQEPSEFDELLVDYLSGSKDISEKMMFYATAQQNVDLQASAPLTWEFLQTNLSESQKDKALLTFAKN